MPPDLSQLNKATVIVVGDVMLDRYFWGEVSRISPEAPVPVLHLAAHQLSGSPSRGRGGDPVRLRQRDAGRRDLPEVH